MNDTPLYVTNPKAVVKKRHNRIVVTVDGSDVASLPVTKLSEVVLFGPVNVTTQAMCALLDNGVSLILLRTDGRARGRLDPPSGSHVQLRRAQLERSLDDRCRLEVGRIIVAGKLANQRVALLQLARRRGTTPEQADELRSLADRISMSQHQVHDAARVSEVLGHEGAGASAYFAGMRRHITPSVGFVNRDRNGDDAFNVSLNYASGMLRELVHGAVAAAGLDPAMSFLHQPSNGRPSLVYDLMEEWRPVIAEPVASAGCNLGIVSHDDLVNMPGKNRPWLSRQARTRLVERFAQRTAAPASSRFDESAGSYRDQVFRQARRFRSWVLGQAVAYEPFPLK